MDLTDVQLLRRGISEKLKSKFEREKLRDKQVDAFKALVSDKFTDEQISHCYFKLPTGFGKTVMFAHMVDAYFDAIKSTSVKRQKIIIIVPRLNLIKQTKDKLIEHVGVSATEYSGRKKDTDCDVIITTYDSLKNLFGIVDFNDVGLIFADEAHHMLGEKISKQLEFYNKFVPIIGFTATPEYESSRAVANMLNTEIFSMNIPDAVTAGVLAPVKNVLYRSSIVCDLSTVPATSSGDYDYDKIVTKISPDTLATEIARIYANGCDEQTGTEFKTLKTIINCPNTKIANLQATKINEIMGRNVAISLHKVGISDKEFEKMQDKFIAGEYIVACQVGTMTEGFDDQTVSLCINYPMRSRVKAEQCAGRVIRINEADPKKVAFVVDTIFRATHDEKIEDVLYTASRAQQVLFKDIADGNIVLYPKDFNNRNAGLNDEKKRTHVEFVDFDLITDSTTLIELNHKTMERMADEFIPQKTDEWLSAVDLMKNPDFPSGDSKKINNALNDLEHDPEFEGFIQNMKSRGNIVKCIHK
ncbi:MAG: DEAD/DEAH box helicase, partial [Alphaproteobacteria bacterium]